jgi:hypothetical protein
MSDPHDSVLAALEGSAEVRKMIDRRVFNLVAPHGTARPYLVYQLVSHARGHTFDGPDVLTMPVFQLKAVGRNGEEARKLAKLARRAVDGNRRDFEGAFVENAIDDVEAGSAGEGHDFITRLDVQVAHGQED